jgi:hypothetical protein
MVSSTLFALSLSLSQVLAFNIARREAAPATVESRGAVWQPAVGSSWQIVLINPIKLDATSTSVTPNVDVFDIDLFDNPKTTFDALRRLGKKSVCYFSAGTYEPNRPDSARFKASDRGSELADWPGEYWLNTNSQNVRNIMADRIALAVQKGCDAIDPDNMDAYVSFTPCKNDIIVANRFLHRATPIMVSASPRQTPSAMLNFSQKPPLQSMLQRASKMLATSSHRSSL